MLCCTNIGLQLGRNSMEKLFLKLLSIFFIFYFTTFQLKFRWIFFSFFWHTCECWISYMTSRGWRRNEILQNFSRVSNPNAGLSLVLTLMILITNFNLPLFNRKEIKLDIGRTELFDISQDLYPTTPNLFTTYTRETELLSSGSLVILGGW